MEDDYEMQQSPDSSSDRKRKGSSQEHLRSKRAAPSNQKDGSMNAASGPTKDGWGYDIEPAWYQNTLSRRDTQPGVLKNDVWVTLDFTGSATVDTGSTFTDPYIMPYQSLNFWFPYSNQNTTLTQFNDIMDSSWGWAITKGEIKITCDVVTTEQLVQAADPYTIAQIQQSQNLIIAYHNRQNYFARLNANHSGPAGGNTPAASLGWARAPAYDIFKSSQTKDAIDQVPMKQSKNIHVSVPKLPQQKAFRKINTATRAGIMPYMLPGAHNYTTITTAAPLPVNTWTWASSSEIVENTIAEPATGNFTATALSKTLMPMKGYPAIFLGHPEVPNVGSEYMPMKIRVCIQTELHYVGFGNQDLNPSNYQRNLIDLPNAPLQTTTDLGAAICIPMVPYNYIRKNNSHNETYL